MNIENYVKKISEKEMGELILTNAYFDLVGEQKISLEQFNDVAKIVREKYQQKLPKEELKTYLQSKQSQATPEALKTAKKTVKSYIEQLIYKDEKEGVITPLFARMAKHELQTFL